MYKFMRKRARKVFKQLPVLKGEIGLMQRLYGKELVKRALNISKETGLNYYDIIITLKEFPEVSEKAIKIAKERGLCPWDVAFTLKNFPEEASEAIKKAEWENQASWIAINLKRQRDKNGRKNRRD